MRWLVVARREGARLSDEGDARDGGEADAVQGDFYVAVAGSGVGQDIDAFFCAGVKSGADLGGQIGL